MRLSFIFIVFICLYSHSTKSQYQSFFGKNATNWNSLTMDLDGNFFTDSIAYEKDTIIQLIPFRKANWYMASPINSYITSSFFREDTTTGRLWHLWHPDSTEKLIVDLSLSLSDNFSDPVTGLLCGVDSVYYINGLKHVRVDAEYEMGKLIFIEGVGTNIGIGYDGPFSGIYLLCQMKDGQPNYANDHFQYGGLCNVSALSIEEHFERTEEYVFPNPTTGTISIHTGKDASSMRVQVIDVAGKIVIEQTCTTQPMCQVNISAFEAGVYFMRIVCGYEKTFRHHRIALIK